MSANKAAQGGGLTVRQRHPTETDVQVDGDASLVQLHQTLADGLDEAIVAALRDLPGDRRNDYRDHLREMGIGALDGRLADALARLAHGTDVEADAASAHAHRAAFHLLRGLGSGTVDGQPTTRDDVRTVLPSLLASTTAPDATPTVSVRLGVGWPSRRKQQRADVLRYLSALAVGVDLHLVTADAAAVCVIDEHEADVPTWVLTNLRNRRCSHTPHAADEPPETVDDALRSLSRGGRPAGVLRALSRSPTDTLDYDGLTQALPIDSAPYQAVSRLADNGLVETTEAADGRTVVSLTLAGVEVGDVLTTEQARLRGRRRRSRGPLPARPRLAALCRCAPRVGTAGRGRRHRRGGARRR